MESKKKVLVCPLNWGLGHACRDVPLIKALLEHNYLVIIGADKASLAFLRLEFPQMPYVKIPFPEVTYPKKGRMAIHLFKLLPKILWGIYQEHQLLKKIIKLYDIDIVISDNRYGLWNKNISSIFVYHQLNIIFPEKWKFLEGFANKINRWYINNYNSCWVPDFAEKNNIAGILSHPKQKIINERYINLLSRFNLKFSNEINFKIKDYDLLIVLSGPEPQRTIFEQLIFEQAKLYEGKILLLLGKPEQKVNKRFDNIELVNHLPTKQLQYYLQNTPFVISRSGYSSIMDYVLLQVNAILVPTPGQTEQEYLANRLKEKRWFYSLSQNNFELNKAINECKKYQVPALQTFNPNLAERSKALANPDISGLLESL